MSLEEVEKKLNKIILLNKKIPEELRMLQMEKTIPDEKKIFSKEREIIVKKLQNREYKSNEELRKDLKKIKFDLSWEILRDFRLSGYDFSNVNFTACDASGADFSGCNLAGADFSLSLLLNTNFSRAEMHSAMLLMTDSSVSNFSGANLTMVDFRSCISVGTNFMSSNLTGSDFTNSNLRNSKFEGANTTGIILNDCILEGTIFEWRGETRPEEKRRYEEEIRKIYEGMEEAREYISHISPYKAETTYKKKGYK